MRACEAGFLAVARSGSDSASVGSSPITQCGVSVSRAEPRRLLPRQHPPGAAAYHAFRGTLPRRKLHRVALLSDGAARLVERFTLIERRPLLDQLTAHDLPQVSDAPVKRRRARPTTS